MGELHTLLEAVGAPFEPAALGGWIVHVPTERRGSISVHAVAAERTLMLRAFLFRGPDRGHVDVYRRLLEKNRDIRHWRLALDPDGDIVAAADVRRAGLDAAELDGLLGALSALVDEIYAGVLRDGFGAQTS